MYTIARPADVQCWDTTGASFGASSQPSFSIHESNVLCCACLHEMHVQPTIVCGCATTFTHPPFRIDLSVCRSNVHRSKVSFVSLLVMTNTIFCSSPRTSQPAQHELSWHLRLIFKVHLNSFSALACRAAYPTFAPALCSGSQSGQCQSKP